jgi:superfamily II DNA or RNA helicase
MSDIVLRPYQSSSIQELREGFKEGHKRQILSAATGAGKSILAMAMLDAARDKGSRVMFVCDRRVLVNQFSKHLTNHGIEHGVYMADHWRYRPHEKVQVASIQTLEKMKNWPHSELIFIDEIHAVMRKSLKTFMNNNPETKIIGLTATPFQQDLGKYFTNIVNVVTMEQLVKEEFLVPFRVFVATEIDTRGVKVTAGEWQKDELEQRGLKVVGNVVEDYIRISQDVFGEYRKTICFSSGVKHGAELVRKFSEHGLNFVQISYLDSEDYKEQVLREFSKPDTEINGVISSDILTRGFDQTDVEHIIIAKPLRKSFSMHVQIVGRGARSHPGKKFCVIQDNSGNWLRFSEDWDQVFHEGTKSLANDADTKKRKEPTEREKKEAKCPSCGHVWPKKSDICSHCGHVRERKALVDSVRGVMQELTGGVHREEKQRFFSELVFLARSRGYKPGWSAIKYKEKYGVYPRGLQDVPMTPSMATLKWVQSRQIAWAKSKRRQA